MARTRPATTSCMPFAYAAAVNGTVSADGILDMLNESHPDEYSIAAIMQELAHWSFPASSPWRRADRHRIRRCVRSRSTRGLCFVVPCARIVGMSPKHAEDLYDAVIGEPARRACRRR